MHKIIKKIVLQTFSILILFRKTIGSGDDYALLCNA